jgi:large subunit ribosomal protein L9
MQVILREDVPELGIIGDVVEVKPGYARNYLIPRGMAVPADRRNLRQLEHDKRIIEVKKQRERGTYERLAPPRGDLKL